LWFALVVCFVVWKQEKKKEEKVVWLLTRTEREGEERREKEKRREEKRREEKESRRYGA